MIEEYTLPRCGETGKVCYRKRAAETMKNHRTKGAIRRREGKRAEFLRIYQCPHCDYWHLTHHKTY